MKYRVLFQPANKTVEMAKGKTVMEAAQNAGVFIDAPCGGKGHCGKCKVKILSGKHHFPSNPVLSPEEINEGIRLACETKILGDMVIELKEINMVTDILVEDITSSDKKKSQIKNILNHLKEINIKGNNGIKTISVEIPPPSIDDNIPDWERVERELKSVVNSKKLECPYTILKKIPGVLRKSDYNANIILWEKDESYEILDIRKNQQKIYGLCVDIGTTTVAACLVNLCTNEIEASANSGNLQMQYGGDVINRIIFSTKKDGLEKLQKAIIEGSLNQLIDRMTKQLNIDVDSIYSAVFAGNTTMTHLLLGVTAENIRLEPYIPAFRKTTTIKAQEIGLNINPLAPLYIIPNVASYVGGDIVSGTLAAGFWKKPEITLFLDLGTNGEIVLGSSDWMLSCACSAGPAFEGGEISSGMRATLGAIDKVKIHKRNLEPEIRVIGNTKPKGICGSGIIDLIAEMFMKGIIDQRGKIKQDLNSERIRFNPNIDSMEYILVWGDNTEDSHDISINEIDIDNFLRAKGAVYSGARTLLNTIGMDIMDIDKIIIAGGIGQNLDIQNSINIGLMPDIDKTKFTFIGNSSLLGAYSCLISTDARKKVHEIADMITYIELSNDPTYMEEFVSACFLPHTDIRLFPSLKKVIGLSAD